MDDLFQRLRFSPLGFSGDNTNMKFYKKIDFSLKKKKLQLKFF